MSTVAPAGRIKLKSGLREWVEYLIYRDFQFKRQFEDDNNSHRNHQILIVRARVLSSMRLTMLAAILVQLADAATGSHAMQHGGILAWFAQLMVFPAILIWLFNRWLGVDANRAVETGWRRVKQPAALLIGYRLMSLVLLPPLVMASAMMNSSLAHDADRERLVQVYAALRARHDADVLRLLADPAVTKRWTPERASMAALAELRLGRFAEAKTLIENGIRSKHTTYTRGLGSHLSPINRRDCESYIAQASFPDAHQDLNLELRNLYCREFGWDFPQGSIPKPGTYEFKRPEPAPIPW